MWEQFTDKKNLIAVVGVSADEAKFGARIFRTLIFYGFQVVGVNPKYKELYNQPIYPSIKDLPKKPDVVITVVPPQVTEQIVKEVKEAGITKFWMQEGSESDAAIEFCKQNKIEFDAGKCFIRDALATEFAY
jgi:hypothetical protein